MRLNRFSTPVKISTDIRNIPCEKQNFFNIDGILNSIGPIYDNKGTRAKVMPITMQITEDCNLRCSYCFQINKSKNKISIDDCKRFFDYLLTRTEENCKYVNPTTHHMLSIGFVGGDALLEIDLIDEILTYFVEKAIELNHPWANNWIAHLDTNGVLYFDKRVQKLAKKWPNCVSFCITVEGDQTLHDSCRVFPDGSGSYKYAERAAMDQFKHGRDLFSKITTAPQNIDYLYDAFINMIKLGYTYIYSNPVFENVWTDNDANRYYHQFIRIADYLISNKLYDSIMVPILELDKYKPYENLYDNTCGGNGAMLALSYDRNIYNCYRYTSSSITPGIKLLPIGNLDHGIGGTKEEQINIIKLQSMNRLTCSDMECLHCNIAENCNQCNGCNYNETGDPSKKTKYHCLVHHAGYLAAVYYYNNINKDKSNNFRYDIIIDKNKINRILSAEEYNILIKSWR